MTPARRFALALGVIALVALGARWAFVLGVDPQVPEVGDAMAYHHLANHLAEGRGYIRPFDLLLADAVRPTAEYPPLFPGVLSVAARLGVTTVTGQRLVAALLGTGAVVLVGLLGRRVAGPAEGLVAAGAAALHPALLLGDATLMPETLFVALVAATVLTAYGAARTRHWGWFAAVGALAGLAALSRAEGLLLGPLLVLPLAASRRWRAPPARRLLVAAVGAVAMVAVLLPWTARNHARFDTFVPVSNNLGTVLDGANCPPTYAGPYIGFWLYTEDGACFGGFDQAGLARHNEAVVAADHRARGLRFARTNAERLPVVAPVRLLRTWGLYAPSQQARLESLEGRPFAWGRAATFVHWGLLALAVPGGVLLWRRRVEVWPLLAGVAVVAVTAVATYGNQRFRAAAEPALLVLAAVAVVALVDRARGTGHGQDRRADREREPADHAALQGGEHEGGPVEQR